MSFVEALPSHTAKAAGVFPGAKDLLGPVAVLVDWAIPCGKPSIGFILSLGPDAGDNDTRVATTVTPVASRTGCVDRHGLGQCPEDNEVEARENPSGLAATNIRAAL
jgi:hypothetical protein